MTTAKSNNLFTARNFRVAAILTALLALSACNSTGASMYMPLIGYDSAGVEFTDMTPEFNHTFK